MRLRDGRRGRAPMVWVVAARLGLAPRARAAAGELDAFCRELRDQLGPFGYQWLCACAVYPGLRFTLSTHLGVALAGALKRPPPDEEEHAALFRLPWFRKGWMPDP